MIRNSLSMVAVFACLAVPTGALAQVRAFGAGFDGWVFTATTEKPGIVNCRATRRVGGRDDIIAMRNDHKPYLSVKADGRRGKWPGSFAYVPGKPRGVSEWKVDAEANAVRLWLPIEAGAVGLIAAAGVYEISLADTEDTIRVPLGRRAAEAWARVNQCVLANGG